MRRRRVVAGVTGLILLAGSCTNNLGGSERSVPNGDIAFVNENGGLYLMHADGTGVHRLPVGNRTNAIAWSPDGTKLLFCCWSDELAVVGADGSGLHAIARPVSSPVYALTWSPDGRMIAEVAGALVVMNANGTGQETYPSGRGTPEYVWSPDGGRVALVEGNGTLVLMNADGTDQRTVGIEDFPFVQSLSWSPDGTRLVLTSCTAHGECEVYLLGADGGGLREIHSQGLPAQPYPLQWSPDGGAILVDGVFVMNPDGSGVRQLAQGIDASWSPDGREILLMRLLNPEAAVETAARYLFAIQVIDADGSNLTTIAKIACETCVAPVWQPRP